MKKINLQIAIITIISLIVSAFAPIAYATTTDKKLETEITTNETIENTDEKEENTTDNKVKDAGEVVVVVDGDKIYGEAEKEIRLEFSASNMPKVEIKRMYDGKLEGLGTWYKVLYNDKVIANSNEVIKKEEGNIFFKITDNDNNEVKTIYIVKKEIDTKKYNITTTQDPSKGVAFRDNTLSLERGKTSFEFVYENGEENIFSDVTVTVADEKIAEVVTGEYGEVKIKALAIGSTTVTFEGKSIKDGSVTINVNVVRSLYPNSGKPNTGNSNNKPNTGSSTNNQNQGNTNKPAEDEKDDNKEDDNENKEDDNENDDNENDDVIPDEEYTFTKYDERENIYSDYTKLNEELLQQTDALEVTVEGNHSVKANVFKTLKKYPNKKLVINSSASGIGRITWEFDSNTITNTNVDFKPSAQFSTEKLNSIKSDDNIEGIYMDLAHNGNLPGKATVSLWLGDELTNKYMEKIDKEMYLYYYNPSSKKYEFVGNAKMVDYGTIEFELEHCSIYVFSTSKLEGKTTRPLDEEPKTGVENHLVIASLIAIVSLAGIITLKKQEKISGKHFIK